MEQFLAEVEAYAAVMGVQPTTVVQRAVGASGAAWGKWKSGASCSLVTADRVRTYMAANWPASAPMPDSLKPYQPTNPREAAE